MLSNAGYVIFSNPPLTAENGITDICSAVFAFGVTNNVTKTLFKKEVICKKPQVALIVCELDEDLQQKTTLTDNKNQENGHFIVLRQ